MLTDFFSICARLVANYVARWQLITQCGIACQGGQQLPPAAGIFLIRDQGIAIFSTPVKSARLAIRFDPARGYISADALRDMLRGVHVLLGPIQPDTEFRLHREVYGISKVSGAEGDCLALGRPLLIPASYVCARYAEPLVVHYADLRDLVAVMNRLNDATALQALYERLHAVSASAVHAAMAAEFLATVLPGCAPE